MLQKAGNIATVMNRLGHSDVKTAMKYQHVELNAVRDADWLPPRDSNPDMLIQSQLSCR